MEWTKAAERDLRKLDPPVARRIIAAVERWAEHGTGDFRPLRGHRRRHRLRVGDYRVLLEAVGDDEDTWEVIRVGHRREVYE